MRLYKIRSGDLADGMPTKKTRREQRSKTKNKKRNRGKKEEKVLTLARMKLVEPTIPEIDPSVGILNSLFGLLLVDVALQAGVKIKINR